LSKLAAKLTPGFSGAEIAGSCNEAALHAAAENKEFVTLADLEVAIDRQIGGLEKKSKVLSLEEKKIVAYHEAGHALVGWFLEYANPLLKVSIIPRGTAALGFSQYLPKDQYLLSQEQMQDQLATLLGGRMAEEVQFGSITTGASDDLAKVTRLAYALVNRYGMTDVGPLSYRSLDETGAVVRQYSDATAEIMDLEVRRIVQEASSRARSLVQQHKAGLESLAQVLMEKEVINRQQVEDILGKRPFADTDEPTAEVAM
jgi:AFG3 family protein